MSNSGEHALLNFEKLMERYGESLMRLAFTYVKNHQVAEDIVQDVFIKAFEKKEEFRGDASYQTYLYRMTVNRCHDYFRSWSFKNLFFTNKQQHLRLEKSAESEVIEKTEQYLLGEQILSLPLKYREVIVFYYYKEYRIEEIAKILEISPSTVKTRLKRAKERLKIKISSKVGEEYG
ncbi:sigma-70 family RNA polymerase sigma factor [Solibacillus sp. CAU 1738]|uniref:sigma-70 family RNA polymerase sigma factor n=1 Tax=Solibacillus sp. CAU 1738 TaxID=3140363 RepID=UPI00326177B2